MLDSSLVVEHDRPGDRGPSPSVLHPIPFEELRIARHLRNALAHADPVNRDTLDRHLRVLDDVVQPSPEASARRDAGSIPPAPAPPPFDVTAYRVHAWRDRELESEMLANGFVSVGGEEIGDLTDVEDPEAIRALLAETMPDRSARAISLFVGYWRRFRCDATPGDLVVLPTRNRAVAIGELVGPYHYVRDVDPRARHRRAVSWNAVDVARDAIGRDLVVTLNGQHTVQEFKARDAVARLRALAATGRDPGAAQPGRGAT